MTLTISIPVELNSLQREAIGIDVIDFIIDRTKSGVDMNNSPLASYTKGYKETFEYKIGHGSDSDVNLTLTGEMLGSMVIVSHGAGFIKLGFNDKDAAEKAQWIQSPTGQKAGKQRPRKFFGINDKDLNKIIDRHRSKTTAFSTNATRSLSENIVKRLLGF